MPCILLCSWFPLPFMLFPWLFALIGIVLIVLVLMFLLLSLAFLLVDRPIFLVLDPVLCNVQYVSPTRWVSFWMSKMIILRVIPSVTTKVGSPVRGGQSLIYHLLIYYIPEIH